LIWNIGYGIWEKETRITMKTQMKMRKTIACRLWAERGQRVICKKESARAVTENSPCRQEKCKIKGTK